MEVSSPEGKTAIGFTSSALVLQAATLVCGVICLRWIGPEQMGRWHTITLMQGYAAVFRLGIVNAMNRQMPYLLGQGRREDAYAVAETCLAFECVATALSVVTVGVCIAIMAWSDISWVLPAFMMSLAWPLSAYYNFAAATMRSDSDFAALTKLQFVQTGATVLTVPCCILGGFVGFLFGYVLQNLTAALLAFRCSRRTYRPRFRLPVFKALLGDGVPLSISHYLNTLTLGMDRTVLLAIGGPSAVGQYAPAQGILTAVAAVPNTLSTYLYPKLSFMAGRGDRPAELWRWMMSFVVVVMGVTAVALVPVWLLLPKIIAIVLPQYTSAASPAQYAVVAAWFMLALSALALLRSLGKFRLLLIFSVSFLVLRGALPLLFARRMVLLDAVAVGTMVAAALGSCLAIFVAYRSTHGRRPSVKQVAEYSTAGSER